MDLIKANLKATMKANKMGTRRGEKMAIMMAIVMVPEEVIVQDTQAAIVRLKQTQYHVFIVAGVVLRLVFHAMEQAVPHVETLALKNVSFAMAVVGINISR